VSYANVINVNAMACSYSRVPWRVMRKTLRKTPLQPQHPLSRSLLKYRFFSILQDHPYEGNPIFTEAIQNNKMCG